jgi:DNA-binding LytR/AlgR family response regulator
MALLVSSVAGSFHTIIISGNTEHALRAFDHGVIDFVAKPFTEERFAQALRRVTDPEGRAPGAARCLAVRKRGRIELVPVADVLYVQGADDYTELVLGSGRRELHDKTLDRLQAILPVGFERIHKSFLVRLSEIVSIHSLEGSRWEAELKNGVRLPVGRTHHREIKARLG